MISFFKKLLGVEGPVEEDDIEQTYMSIINSSKYADSNSNTHELERLFKAIHAESVEKEATKREAEIKDPVEGISQQVEGLKIYGAEIGNKFIDRLGSHLRLLKELESEDASVLPGQPVYTRAKFGKEGGTNFSLRQFPIPKYIYQALECNNVNMLHIGGPLAIDNYVRRFQTLLWLEEAHQAIEMRRYDMMDIMLAKYETCFFLIHVPGLAEGRPSLMCGDRLFLKSGKRSSFYEGYIHEVRERDIIVKLHESLHSTAMDGLKFDISFQTSRTPFRRCHHGVLQFDQSPHMKSLVFPDIKSKDNLADFKICAKETSTAELRCFNGSLNVYQRRAVINVLRGESRPAPYIVFGPPGTGKTMTMVEAILQVYARKRDAKILVCGNSNSCADLLAKRIQDSEVVPKDKMVRVMAFYRMEKLVPPELEEICKDMDMIDATMYSSYRIVISTCIQTGALNEFKDRFDYVFIDEAGHANEPEALISIGLMKRDGVCVLAGDPHQLGPVCMSKVAETNGLGSSLLERLSRRSVYQRQSHNFKMVYDERYITKLIICYRCDPRVLTVNNELFYHNELEFKNKTPESWLKLLKVTNPLIFHTVKGRDRREYVNPSWFNPNETIACLGYVVRLYKAGLKPCQLGIITPYRRQIEKLNLLFESCRLQKCKIATMEEFQGDEREVIIISTVRTREKNLQFDQKFNLGFLFNPKRFNVAISRAKWLVIVVGDPEVLKRDNCWVKLFEKAYKIEEPQNGTKSSPTPPSK